MNDLSLKFKDQSLKATSFYTLTVKLFTVFYWRSLTFICVFLFFSPAFADQPDIRDLDRMFTTRYERAQLDALRRHMSTGEDINANATDIVAPAPVNVEMQGIMQRDNGGNVAWINGQSTLKSNTIDDNIRVSGQPKALSGANVSIGGQTVRLKPGQVWQQEDGKIVERYKTKVAVPVTKGADEVAQDVQTESDAKNAKPAAVKPEINTPETNQPKP